MTSFTTCPICRAPVTTCTTTVLDGSWTGARVTEERCSQCSWMHVERDGAAPPSARQVPDGPPGESARRRPPPRPRAAGTTDRHWRRAARWLAALARTTSP